MFADAVRHHRSVQIGSAHLPDDQRHGPLPRANSRIASIIRIPARDGPSAISAIIQCGSVKAERQVPIRASALSAISRQRSRPERPAAPAGTASRRRSGTSM